MDTTMRKRSCLENWSIRARFSSPKTIADLSLDMLKPVGVEQVLVNNEQDLVKCELR